MSPQTSTQLSEPSDSTLSPKYQICNLSTRISRLRLASEITLPNLRSKFLKSGLVSCSSSLPHALPRTPSCSAELMSWLRHPSGQDLYQEQPNRGKDTAKALTVFQGCKSHTANKPQRTISPVQKNVAEQQWELTSTTSLPNFTALQCNFSFLLCLRHGQTQSLPKYGPCSTSLSVSEQRGFKHRFASVRMSFKT